MADSFERGAVCIMDPGSDIPLYEEKTYQCVHCGGHWIAKAGSGNKRGFCGPCHGYVCSPKCLENCVPAEYMIENIEHGRDLWTPPPAKIVCGIDL